MGNKVIKRYVIRIKDSEVNFIETYKGVKIYQNLETKKYSGEIRTKSIESKNLEDLKVKIEETLKKNNKEDRIKYIVNDDKVEDFLNFNLFSNNDSSDNLKTRDNKLKVHRADYTLKKGIRSEAFKQYLRDRGIYFEPSEHGKYIHFAVFGADDAVDRRANEIVRTLKDSTDTIYIDADEYDHENLVNVCIDFKIKAVLTKDKTQYKLTGDYTNIENALKELDKTQVEEDTYDIGDSKNLKDKEVHTSKEHTSEELLGIFLKWNGIIGYTNILIDIYNNEGSEELREYIEEEGFGSYANDIIGILTGDIKEVYTDYEDTYDIGDSKIKLKDMNADEIIELINRAGEEGRSWGWLEKKLPEEFKWLRNRRGNLFEVKNAWHNLKTPESLDEKVTFNWLPKYLELREKLDEYYDITGAKDYLDIINKYNKQILNEDSISRRAVLEKEKEKVRQITNNIHELIREAERKEGFVEDWGYDSYDFIKKDFKFDKKEYLSKLRNSTANRRHKENQKRSLITARGKGTITANSDKVEPLTQEAEAYIRRILREDTEDIRTKRNNRLESRRSGRVNQETSNYERFDILETWKDDRYKLNNLLERLKELTSRGVIQGLEHRKGKDELKYVGKGKGRFDYKGDWASGSMAEYDRTGRKIPATVFVRGVEEKQQKMLSEALSRLFKARTAEELKKALEDALEGAKELPNDNVKIDRVKKEIRDLLENLKEKSQERKTKFTKKLPDSSLDKRLVKKYLKEFLFEAKRLPRDFVFLSSTANNSSGTIKYKGIKYYFTTSPKLEVIKVDDLDSKYKGNTSEWVKTLKDKTCKDLSTKVRQKSGYFDEQLDNLRIKEIEEEIRFFNRKKRTPNWSKEDDKYLRDYIKELQELKDKPRKFNFDDNKEDKELYIYLFPVLTRRDKVSLKTYDLEYLGRNEYKEEINDVVKGTKDNLERYADEYLGYVLHEDYLYEGDDFVGEIK